MQSPRVSASPREILLALGWQALWVALVVWLSVRLFRAGARSSGSGWKFWRRKKTA